MGRSRGGLTTKVHVLTDARGLPLDLVLTEGQAGDCPAAKHFAGIGFSYREDLNAFVPPSPYPSWQLNEATCQWEPPVPEPQDGLAHVWDEDTLQWIDAL